MPAVASSWIVHEPCLYIQVFHALVLLVHHIQLAEMRLITLFYHQRKLKTQWHVKALKEKQ